MAYGPIELVVIKFHGNKFNGQIVPELAKLVDADIVHIIDILFVTKDSDSTVHVLELNDVDEETNKTFGPLITGLAGILSEEDAIAFAAAMEPDSSIGMMLFENTWAAPFVKAVHQSHGEVVMNERIPRRVIEELAAA